MKILRFVPVKGQCGPLGLRRGGRGGGGVSGRGGGKKGGVGGRAGVDGEGETGKGSHRGKHRWVGVGRG